MTPWFEQILLKIVSLLQSELADELAAFNLEPIPPELINAGHGGMVGDNCIFVSYVGTERRNQHRDWRDCTFLYEVEIYRFGHDRHQLQIDCGRTEVAICEVFDQGEHRTLDGLVKRVTLGDSEGAFAPTRQGLMGHGIVLPIRCEKKVSRPELAA